MQATTREAVAEPTLSSCPTVAVQESIGSAEVDPDRNKGIGIVFTTIDVKADISPLAQIAAPDTTGGLQW